MATPPPLELTPRGAPGSATVVVPLSSTGADGKATLFEVRDDQGTALFSVDAVSRVVTALDVSETAAAGTAAAPGVAVGAATVGLFSGGSGATEYLGLAANGIELLRVTGDANRLMQHRYDASNHLSVAVGSGGQVQSFAAGTSPYFDWLVNGTHICRATSGGMRLETVLTDGPNYLFQVATTNSALTLCVSDSLDTVGVGTAPIADQRLAVVAGGAALGVVASTSGTGTCLYGWHTGTSGASVNATGAGTSGSSIPLSVVQGGSLVGNLTGAAAHIHRTPTLNGFDATGAVLQVEDSTASTGNLLSIIKQGTAKMVLTSANLLVHYYDGSNYMSQGVGSAGGITANAQGTVPCFQWNILGSGVAYINNTGLRLETGLTGGSNYLLQVATTNSALTLCVSDASDCVSSGIAPNALYQFYAYSTGRTAAIVGHESTGYSVYAYNNGGGVALRADAAAGASLAVSATSHATSGLPVALLEQLDTDQQFIEFTGTETANAASSLSSWTVSGAVNGHIRISVNGTDRWIPTYAAPIA